MQQLILLALLKSHTIFIPLYKLTVYIKKKLNNFHVKLKSATNKKCVIIISKIICYRYCRKLAEL